MKDSNNAHRQIIRLLEDKRDSFDSVVSEYLGPKEGLISPPSKGKGSSNGKGSGRVDYPEQFEAFWKLYKVGAKKPAYEAWKKQKLTEEDITAIMECVPKYKAHCASADRSLKDGQGWLNQRFWESEWNVHATQAPRTYPKSVVPDFVN